MEIQEIGFILGQLFEIHFYNTYYMQSEKFLIII